MTRAPFLLVTGDFVRTGGMDAANHALATHLAERGHEVHLVAHRAAPDLVNRGNVHLHAVAKPLGAYLLGAPFLDFGGRRWARRITAGGGRVLVNGGNCRWGDINWVHYVHAAFRPPVAGTVIQRGKHALAHALALSDERKSVRAARVIIANSERTRDDIVRHLDVDPARVEVVYYGTDSAALRPRTAPERSATRQWLDWPSDRPMVAFIGALGDRRKGFDIVFEAWRILSGEASWDAGLAVIGAGSELPRWRQRAEAHGLGDRIQFLGFRSDVPTVLGACDAMVHPARYEAYGLGVQEAVCLGIPAIVSATAGIAERYPAALRDLLLPAPAVALGLAERLWDWRRSMHTYPARVLPFSNELRATSWDAMAARIVALTT